MASKKTNSRLRKLASGRRSKLEERAEISIREIDNLALYEPDRIYFTQPSVDRYYVPDFKLSNGTYIEVKGRLTIEDRRKMIWVKEQNPDAVIRLIFGNANNKLDKRSKTSYREWAEKNGFDCIDVSEPIPKAWFNKLESLSKKRKTIKDESN